MSHYERILSINEFGSIQSCDVKMLIIGPGEVLAEELHIVPVPEFRVFQRSFNVHRYLTYHFLELAVV